MRLNTRNEAHYFCTGMLCSRYCEYHRLRQCEWDQYVRDERKRDEEDQPPPPPPEDPEETIFDRMIAPECMEKLLEQRDGWRRLYEF